MSEAIPIVINEFDVQSVFANWTQEDWARHAGKVLVLSVNPKAATRDFVTSVDERSEFDVEQFVSANPGHMVQFFELPAPGSIGNDPEAATPST